MQKVHAEYSMFMHTGAMALEFSVDPDMTDKLQAEIVACWTDVSNAGGAVGFVPPVAMDDVLPVAAKAMAGVAAGHDRLIVGRETGVGRLAALAVITDGQFRLTEHWRTVKRVMVHPDFQGRGYGVQLMVEVERVARDMGLELLTLDCRGGTGNDEFYKKCGYTEYGRLPGALRLGADDYRDQILMTLPL
jgi:GNAT superfamily N-acetyltransferase